MSAASRGARSRRSKPERSILDLAGGRKKDTFLLAVRRRGVVFVLRGPHVGRELLEQLAELLEREVGLGRHLLAEQVALLGEDGPTPPWLSC